MQEIEKLIEVLNGTPSDGHNGVVYRVSSENMNTILNLLRTLQPSEHGELVNEYRDKIKTIHPQMDINAAYYSIKTWSSKAIAALEAPRPFDVLAHLREGGVAQNETLGVLYWDDEVRKFKAKKDGQIYNVQVDQLIAYDWHPCVDLEPSAEELIEDARIEVMDIIENYGSADKITKALDAFEKLTLEK